MTAKQQKILHIPQGTESFYLEEAYKHRAIDQELSNLFSLWGYFPVETPVFDFFDTYRHLLNNRVKNVYRLIDREGDLLMLRSDITLFLAKQMGLILHDEDLPVRVCYSGTILRHQNRDDISKNEFFQVGAELIGPGGIEADLEVVLLMYNTFTALGLSPYVHIGSHRFIQKGLPELDDTSRYKLMDIVRSRDWETLDSLLAAPIEEKRKRSLMELFRFIGTPSEFREELKTHGPCLVEEEKEALTYIEQAAHMLKECEPGIEVRIDLSEVGSQPYYTGIVFQAYLPGIDAAAASGGRYDTLLRSFGFDTPSAGFMILLRKIEPFIKDRFTLPEKIQRLPSSPDKPFGPRYKRAQDMRKRGEITIL